MTAEFSCASRFQLHHTGIKTQDIRGIHERYNHFNCTIQELKQERDETTAQEKNNFNCTIQELKH